MTVMASPELKKKKKRVFFGLALEEQLIQVVPRTQVIKLGTDIPETIILLQGWIACRPYCSRTFVSVAYDQERSGVDVCWIPLTTAQKCKV